MTDIVPLDTFWPFDEPEGQFTKSVTSMLRWRKMARLWCHWGVVAGHRHGVFGPITREAGHFLIGGGAAVVNGFYGERYNWSDVATPGDDGMVKIRVDSGQQTMGTFFEAWHSWHQDPHASHGVFEVPLYEVWPDGRWVDRRYFVSNEVVEGLPEIPAWVPKGTWSQTFQQETIDVGHGGQVMQAFTDWVPGYTPGRLYRVTASIMDCQMVAGTACNVRVDLRAVRFADQVEVRRRQMLDMFSQVSQLRSGQASFVIWSDNAHITINAHGFDSQFPTVPSNGFTWRTPAWCARIEIYDAGLLTP